MDKTKRDMLRVALQMVAQNVYKLEQEKVGDEPFVVRIKTNYIYPGNYGKLIKEPSVHLTKEGFLELFGDDAEFAYVRDSADDVMMQTRVGGVLFYALVS